MGWFDAATNEPIDEGAAAGRDGTLQRWTIARGTIGIMLLDEFRGIPLGPAAIKDASPNPARSPVMLPRIHPMSPALALHERFHQ